MFDNVLVLSPHMDDEVLGCGGTLLQCKEVHIFYFNKTHPLVSDTQYMGENMNVRHVLNCSVSFSRSDYVVLAAGTVPAVNKMHMNAISWYISEIEALINKHKPDTIFIPCRSRNQDHRVVYDAAITACRFHDTNWLVPNVLLYEQNEYMNIEPNLFVEIDLGKKLELFDLYESQQRGHRKESHIAALAMLRGMEINVPHAEAFQIVRQACLLKS